MPAQLQVDIVGLGAASRRLGKLADAGRDLTPVFADIGEYLVRTTKDRFRSQTDPAGRPWKPLSDDYRKRKKRNKEKVLTLDGYLSGTINYNAARAHVDVGSPMVYAGTHQFGAAKGAFGSTATGQPIPWGDIEAREFLGLSRDDAAEVELLVRDWLAGQL